MKILVTGYSGQLGYDVVQEGKTRSYEMIGISSKELDITNKEAVWRYVHDVKPDVMIHCAAYTAVDQAEDDKDAQNQYEGLIRCVVKETSDTSLIDACSLKIEKMIGDLNDEVFMDKAMKGVDTVVHIASIFYSVSVVNAAVNNNVRRAIFVHTTGIYSKYKSASEEYKNIEKNIKEIIQKNNSNIGLIYLRPTMIYGYINDNNMIVFIKMMDKFRVFPIIDRGENLLQPVNGKDLGKAYYQLLKTTSIINGDYILSGEKPVSMKELFITIGDILGKKTKFINVPLSIGVLMATILKVFSLGKIDYIEKVQRMGEDRSFSHNKAKEDFGYNAMPLVEGLQIEIEEYIKMKNI